MSEGEIEIAANLERAAESLVAAQELYDNGHLDFAASRAYYAAFYAASALLIGKQIKFSKHSSVISAIHKEFIKPGLMSVGLGKKLSLLFEIRSVADYGAMEHVAPDIAHDAVAMATEFFTAVKNMLAQYEVREDEALLKSVRSGIVDIQNGDVEAVEL